MNIKSTVTLNNGVKMPRFGLGVYKSADKTKQAILWALEAGYRLIDTAAFYGNEREVGEAIRESGIDRSEIFVTSKLWNDAQLEDRQIEAVEKSIELLGLDYIDLYLVHWPIDDKYIETWSVLEGFYKAGALRSIGVSNFLESHLEALRAESEITPAVDQLELSPFGSRRNLREYLKQNGIVAEAWAPLSRGKYFDHPTISKIAKETGKTPAQVILRWDIQSDIVTIPKSVTKERIIQNADVFDFELSDKQMAEINALDKEEYSHDPNNLSFLTGDSYGIR